jgi:hypothetical protein
MARRKPHAGNGNGAEWCVETVEPRAVRDMGDRHRAVVAMTCDVGDRPECFDDALVVEGRRNGQVR